MTEPNITALRAIEEFQSTTLHLAEQAQKQIVIFTSNLEPELYNSAAFINAALKLIKRSRYTQIRILAAETKHLAESGHRILTLLRYTDDQFQLKKYHADPAALMPAYFICDDHSIIRRQNPDAYEGLCYYHDRARVRNQLADFDEQWKLASIDPNLRQLAL